MKLIRLTSGRYLRKVKWDQMWHLLEKEPRNDPFKDTPIVPWTRITSQAAGGHLCHLS